MTEVSNTEVSNTEQSVYTGPSYRHVFWSLLTNSLAREMTLRGSFLIIIFTRGFWFCAQLMLFEIIYGNVRTINGWSKYEFFVFMATGMIINTLIEVFFMPNCANFSELIRTGNLDFILLKPIDPQFLVSCGEKLDLGALSNLLLSGSLLYWGVSHLETTVTFGQIVAYLGLIAVGVSCFYSLMISLAAMSVFFGRNQGLYDFWFYITIFARYPRDIYRNFWQGEIIYFLFSNIIPILLIVTVPSSVLAGKVLHPGYLWVILIGLTLLGLYVARRIFLWAINNYRSSGS